VPFGLASGLDIFDVAEAVALVQRNIQTDLFGVFGNQCLGRDNEPVDDRFDFLAFEFRQNVGQVGGLFVVGFRDNDLDPGQVRKLLKLSLPAMPKPSLLAMTPTLEIPLAFMVLKIILAASLSLGSFEYIACRGIDNRAMRRTAESFWILANILDGHVSLLVDGPRMANLFFFNKLFGHRDGVFRFAAGIFDDQHNFLAIDSTCFVELADKHFRSWPQELLNRMHRRLRKTAPTLMAWLPGRMPERPCPAQLLQYKDCYQLCSHKTTPFQKVH
jgi:hypothetical protein